MNKDFIGGTINELRIVGCQETSYPLAARNVLL